MVTSKSNSSCQRCGKNSLLTDEDTGEQFCSKCGFVISEKQEASGPEWRSFQKDGGSDPARTGAPSSLTIHDMGLSTVINPQNRDATGKPLTASMKSTIERLRTWDSRSQVHEPVDRNLRQALSELNKLKDKVAISAKSVTFHSDYRVGFERPYAEDAAALNPPRLGAIEPKTAVQGSDSVEITVMGSRYDEFTTVLFHGTRLPTQAISSTRLKATVDAQLLRNPGTYRVSLEDPRFLWRPSEEYYGFVVTDENPLP